MTFPFDFTTFVIAAAVVGGAYVIFGISDFGAALFTVPILSHFMPLGFVLPMCVLLDVAAAFALGTRISRAGVLRVVSGLLLLIGLSLLALVPAAPA